MRKQKKRAAIEMSISTIVIVVLAMAMLILGLVLIRTIFKGTTNIADMTNTELENQISKLFGEDAKIAIYPSSGQKDMKKETAEAFAFGIKNLISGASGNTKFSYDVVVSDANLRTKCGVSDATAQSWIDSGASQNNIEIAPGEMVIPRVFFKIPSSAALCTINYKITVKADGNTYATDFMLINIKAK